MESVRIRMDQVMSGMTVASDIYTSGDQLIITKDTTLDERKIDKLRFYNIYGILIYKREGKEKCLLPQALSTLFIHWSLTAPGGIVGLILLSHYVKIQKNCISVNVI